jgi:hypothetical protein
MLENFLTDELPLTIAIGGEPDLLCGAQRLTARQGIPATRALPAFLQSYLANLNLSTYCGTTRPAAIVTGTCRPRRLSRMDSAARLGTPWLTNRSLGSLCSLFVENYGAWVRVPRPVTPSFKFRRGR